MEEFSFSAPKMGSKLAVLLRAKDKNSARKTWENLFEIAEKWEQTFSRFRPNSELSRVNRGETKTVSPLFARVFRESKKWYFASEKIFNPLLCPSHLGYVSDFFAGGNEFFETPKKEFFLDFDAVKINEKTQEIFLPPRAVLDFGGFLKGFLAEKLARMAVENREIHSALVHLGGDLFAAGDEFLVEIESPVAGQKSIFFSLPKDTSLCTSATTRRKWGQNSHHILDPKTQISAQTDLLSASVLSRSGAGSDALATVAIIMGAEKAQKFLPQKGVQFWLFKKQK